MSCSPEWIRAHISLLFKCSELSLASKESLKPAEAHRERGVAESRCTYTRTEETKVHFEPRKGRPNSQFLTT